MTDTDTFSDELKQAFRTFIDKQGIPVKFIGIDYSGELLTDFYEGDTSEGEINVSGCRCACREFTDVTLRWTGTLAELINRLAPKDENKKSWTL